MQNSRKTPQKTIDILNQMEDVLTLTLTVLPHCHSLITYLLTPLLRGRDVGEPDGGRPNPNPNPNRPSSLSLPHHLLPPLLRGRDVGEPDGGRPNPYPNPNRPSSLSLPPSHLLPYSLTQGA